ncbi:phosphoadenosine phosphosulfate reductase family protein [Demequina litorisediminis]
MTAILPGAATLTLLNPKEWNAETCAEVNARLEHASASHIADWAVATFGHDLVVAGSMQDTILPHLFGTRLEGVDILFLETGYHFAETIATRDAAAAAFPVTIINVEPELTVAQQDEQYGKDLFARDPNLCCQMRKVEPLKRALGNYRAWVTGARRVDALTRSEMPVVSLGRQARPREDQSDRAVGRRRRGGLPGAPRPSPQPARGPGLSVHRLPAVHQQGCSRRGPALRPLDRPGQDGVRHSHVRRMTRRREA